MRALVQRVSSASVEVEGRVVGAIDQGLLILLGVGKGDDEKKAVWLAEKLANLRIFSDEAGAMNRSLLDVGGGALVVSQFTLYADTRKGRRPSFTAAAAPDQAAPLVEVYAEAMRALAVPVATGVFGAAMRVALLNEGPVTIILDSETVRQPRRG